MSAEGKEYLTLKWGTLKGWEVTSDASLAAIRKYHEDPVQLSVAAQRNTPHQIEAICELIDDLDGEIWNDWDDKPMTKDEAKRYVREYRR